MQSIKSLSRNVECGRKPERQFGAGEIVVDGFGYAQNRKAEPVEFRGYCQGPFAAHYDEAFDTQPFKISERLVVNRFGLDGYAFRVSFSKLAPIARAEDGASPREQAANIGRRQFANFRFSEQSFVTVLNADDAHVEFADGGFHYRANNCVQPGSVSATGDNADFLVHGQFDFAIAYANAQRKRKALCPTNLSLSLRRAPLNLGSPRAKHKLKFVGHSVDRPALLA